MVTAQVTVRFCEPSRYTFMVLVNSISVGLGISFGVGADLGCCEIGRVRCEEDDGYDDEGWSKTDVAIVACVLTCDVFW